MKYNIFENVSQDDLIVSGSTSTFDKIKEKYFSNKDLFRGNPQRIKLDKNNKLVIPGNFIAGNVNFKNPLEHYNRLPFDIYSCKNFVIIHCAFDTLDGFPQTCAELFVIHNNMLRGSISLKNTIVKNKIVFEFVDKCTEIKNVSLLNTKDSTLYFNNCDKLTHISIDHISKEARLHLYGLKSFKSLINLKCSMTVDYVDINDVALEDFESDVKCYNLFVTLNKNSSRNLKSFRKIENFKTKGITITDLQYMYYSAVNLLLCDNNINITFMSSKDPVSGIFRKYVTMRNRKDYIMDCAVELVDEGYPEAAEL